MTKGRIVFQAEGAEIFYRNIEIKQLSPDGPPAGPDKVIITDPALAGPDYDVQGEYVGQSAGASQSNQFAAQVIARGDRRFELVLYTGGLPGDGWQRGDEMQTAEGETVGSVTTFNSPTGSAKLQ